MNILFASTEVTPFAKTGGLADVSGSLPKALGKTSVCMAVIMPFYKCVKDLSLDATAFSVGEFNFLTVEDEGVKYIFVVNDKYYDRDNLYSEPEGDYPDNDLRFSYFSKAVAHFAIEAKPDLIHCNDWQTGLVPVYLEMKGSGIKTLFTVHNMGYQGIFPRESLLSIGIPRNFYNINGMEYYGKISFLKAGIVYSSAISTVSKKYSEEILTKEFGCGMDGILSTRLPNVYGILNGVDYGDWDPARDNYIASKYDPESVEKKIECKKDLIKDIILPPATLERPLVGVISRLAEQKGIDLIVAAAEGIINLGASIVILGTGDAKYNHLCKVIAEAHPEHISSNIRFDNALAHKIEAGCDMFLMPSRYEPCGLNQLYSLRYATLPVVRSTGGLDDTIIDLSADSKNGNGIKFENATKNGVINALARAIKLYGDKDFWIATQRRIMKMDFSWKASAGHYKELYTKLLS